MAMTVDGQHLTDAAKSEALKLADNVRANFQKAMGRRQLRSIASEVGLDVQLLHASLRAPNYTLHTLCRLAAIAHLDPVDMLKPP